MFFFSFFQENQISVISIVMEFAECGDLAQRIQKQREVEKAYFPEVILSRKNDNTFIYLKKTFVCFNNFFPPFLLQNLSNLYF